jgi:hypothetical protein
MTTSQGSPYGYSTLSLGMGLVQGWASRYAQKQDFRVQQGQYQFSLRMGALNNALADQQAATENALRAGSNRLMMARAAADNKLREINNTRLLRRATIEHEQANENFLRNQEALVSGGLEDQIAAAEQRGAYAATSALSGTLGSTVEGMETTLRLKQERALQYRERQGNYATYDQLRQLAGIVPAAISALDTGATVANLDHGISFSTARPLGPDQLIQPNIAGNFFTDAWQWAMNNPDGVRQVGNTVSSWFNTPTVSQHRAPIPGLDI